MSLLNSGNKFDLRNNGFRLTTMKYQWIKDQGCPHQNAKGAVSDCAASTRSDSPAA